eukprot:jgi/Astpho2/9164/e_gw1.00135.21.1_t
MVLFFSPRGHQPDSDAWLMYMGKDKVENEDLIKWGLPHDVWFHVSDMSSAHVYLRLPVGHSVDHIPEDTLEDCCQLVKANSIQGCKENNVDIVWTPWSNLKKTASMEVGQVGFHSGKLVRKVRVDKRATEIINRLNKTKKEAYPDLGKEREAWDHAMVTRTAMAEKYKNPQDYEDDFM